MGWSMNNPHVRPRPSPREGPLGAVFAASVGRARLRSITVKITVAARLSVMSAVALLAVSGCGSSGDSAAGSASSSASDTSSSTSSSSASAGAGQCSYPDDQLAPQAAKKVDKPPSKPAYAGKVDVTITTNEGKIPFVFNADNAPCAVNSVLSLAKQKYYDDSPCSRVAYQAAGFAILQCGDPTGTGAGGPGYVFKEEVKGDETYGAGVIAMAKRQDPGSTGAQFFIMFGDTQLPPQYTVLGKVANAKGMAVIDRRPRRSPSRARRTATTASRPARS